MQSASGKIVCAVTVGLSLLVRMGMAEGQKMPPRAVTKVTPQTTVVALTANPPTVVLNGLYTEARVLLEGREKSGRLRDCSEDAVYTLANTKIATVDSAGTVWPRSDGKTLLTIRWKGRAVQVPVEVKGATKALPPRFLNDVVPVLTRTGCNMGSCHGAAQGKGGFKLSLLGYDPEADYEAITRAASARRVARSQPERSLLLRKPTMSVAHKGGMRFNPDFPEYRLLRDWIAGGLPAPEATEPTVTRLEVIPSMRTLATGQTQKFIVRAHFSDGSQRDTTRQSLFSANEEAVASVTPGGVATVNGSGEGAVLVRYQGLVATARILSPFGTPRVAGKAATKRPANEMDRLVLQKLDALGLEPSGRSSDADFLRRASLDVIGQLPKPEEVKAFLASTDPNKRTRLVDALLERPEYIDFWSMKWGDILRSTRTKLTEKGMYAFHFWIRKSVAENKPWNVFAREIVLARGSLFEDGAANFYRTANNPQELAETTSQVFLGVRIQCARCHNHPYEKWTQNQYYQMAAFFPRVRLKPGERPGEQVVYTVDSGEVNHPKNQKQMRPGGLDAAPVPADFPGDRREALADWLTSPKNPFFAKIIVNRVWKHFMGRGLVEPVDDIRVTNPPSNPALFDFLAQDFVRHNYDLKYLMRSILRSETYQRTALPTRGNLADTKFYSHYPFKRLGAEQLLDAFTSATAVSEKFTGYPMGMRATELPDTNVASYFLDLFGRPARNIACECERVEEPNLGQVLHLMNNAGLNGRIASKEGRVARLINAGVPNVKIVEELYLAAYARFPMKDESRKGVLLLSLTKERQRASEDLLWALLNSKEFLFNH